MIAMIIETKSPHDRILKKKKIFCQPINNLGKHLFKWALWGTFSNLPLLPSPIEQFQIDDTFFHKGVPTFAAACGKFPMTLVRELPTTFSLTYKAPLLPLLSNKLCQQIGSHY